MKTANTIQYINKDVLAKQNVLQSIDFARDFIKITGFSENITGMYGKVYSVEINNKISFSGNENEVKIFIMGCLSNTK